MYPVDSITQIFRVWRDGKIVSSKGLPPGNYQIKIVKVQVDWKGRFQYHIEILHG